MLLLVSLISVGFVLARVTTFREYSAVMTDVTGTYQYVASMVPDPVTGIEQPIIVVNSSSNNYVGGIHSYVGGVATVGGSQSLGPGQRYLEQFDLSSKGWLTWPSTNVSKTAQGTVVYSRNCTRTFWCAYPSSGQVSYTYYPQYSVALEVDRRGSPLFMNVSISPYSFFQFTSFSQQASTYQTDSSVYTLPASFYFGPQTTPNITTMSFYRSATNDSFIRNIWNDNMATAPGEAYWAGCQGLSSVLLFFRFDLQIDQNFGPYLFCNGGMCPSNYLDASQRMGANLNVRAFLSLFFPLTV
jgi:hypothetical protein